VIPDQPWWRQLRWQVAGFLAVAAALNYADRAALSAVLAPVRGEFQLTDVQLALLGSIFLWSYALGSPLAGLLADRWSRTRVIAVSLVLWSGVTAVTGAADGFASLLVLRGALGLAESLYLPAAFALMADWHSAGTRARAMSLISIGVNAGMIAGGSFAGFMAEHHGWRSGFWVLGVGGIALALAARPLLRPPPVPTGRAADPGVRLSWGAALRYLAGVPSYWVLVGESLLSGLGNWIFLAWLPLYFRESFNLTLAQAGFAGTFTLQVSVVLGVIAGGWLSDRVAATSPERRMLLYAGFYLAAAPSLLLFLGQASLPATAAALATFAFLRGMGQANDTPIQCEIVPAPYRSTAVGLMNTVSTAAGGTGVLFAGLLKESLGLGGIFAGVAGIFTLAAALLLTGYLRFVRRDIARARQTFGAGMG
jgi:predicted MFS family arabinose efflux permease